MACRTVFSAKIKLLMMWRRHVAEAQAWLDRFGSHLEEAGLGQISEIFDADEPHDPRGCIAQAWSVSELLRLAKLVHNDRRTRPQPARKSLSSQAQWLKCWVSDFATCQDSGFINSFQIGKVFP
jgi:Glycogen debranching enzyme